jgi:hypothetical protein
LEHITVTKHGVDCAILYFSTNQGSGLAWTMETPERWVLDVGGPTACADARAILRMASNGVLGSFALRKSGDACLIDLHVTVYALTDEGDLKTIRMDLDGAEVGGNVAGLLCE